MILVFGKTGQVARSLADVEGARRMVQLSRAQADLSDPTACAAQIRQHRPKAVINAAAYTAVDRAEDEESLALTINGHAPGAMAQTCADLGIPFLHVSTDYVFAGTGKDPHKPTDPTHPQNAYGRTKLASEVAVRAAGGVHAILRTSWVFSEYGANFVKTMLRLSETRDALSIVNDQFGGPTPARDIAQALLTMADGLQAGQGGGTYHYAGTPTTSWDCLARETFKQAGRAVTVTGIPASNYPTSAKRPLNSRLDCGSLEIDFGILPLPWQDDLTRILKVLA
ncbi:dTDP-4-dehydrorhamnose reductase [Tateyamaria pelophila]|uniref:dTDP-4-dehydrorhamnose reductase n=1 Tax=Tateyamaria pelophila TaxID=328415 RepID=UPI001CC00447|nr:dTDP-4-dehydrorhamnose reductase [Tateyamaria pelophila]